MGESRGIPKGGTAINYIGIDIHKRYSVACVQDESGKTIKRVRIEGNKAGVCGAVSMANQRGLSSKRAGTGEGSMTPLAASRGSRRSC